MRGKLEAEALLLREEMVRQEALAASEKVLNMNSRVTCCILPLPEWFQGVLERGAGDRSA